MKHYLCMTGLIIVLEFPGILIGWTIEVLDNDRGVASSIETDEQDRPFIAYDYGPDYRILYKEGDQWLEVSPPDSSRGMAELFDMEIEPGGEVHLAFNSPWDGYIWYDKWNGESWATEVVDEGYRPSLSLFSNGYPSLSYDISGGFAFAEWNGTSWNIEPVDTSLVYTFSSSLAIDSEGNPRFSYYGAETGQGWLLKYASRDSTGWYIETVDDRGIDRGYMNSLALDSNDNPHIAYIAWFWEVDWDSLEVWYTWKEGNEWQIEVVDKWDGIEPLGWHWEGQISLALDASDVPHISYRNEDRLYFGRRDPGTGEWVREMIDPTAGTGRYTSLAIDSQGYPHISYSANIAQGLRYATQRPTSIGNDNPNSTSMPKSFSLSQNFPNPFNPLTTIEITIPGNVSGLTELQIFDVRGRRIRTLQKGELPPGQYRFVWDGRDDRGETVNSGIYLYSLKSGTEAITRKMTLLR